MQPLQILVSAAGFDSADGFGSADVFGSVNVFDSADVFGSVDVCRSVDVFDSVNGFFSSVIESKALERSFLYLSLSCKSKHEKILHSFT